MQTKTGPIGLALTASFATFGVVACTSLGAMPATTAIQPMSPGRPDIDLQFGGVPGYYLSSAVQSAPKGTAVQQVSAVFDPDDWTALPGLFVGGRIEGTEDTGSYGEPM